MTETEFLIKLKQIDAFKNKSFKELKKINNDYISLLVNETILNGKVSFRTFGKFEIVKTKGRYIKTKGRYYLSKSKFKLKFRCSKHLNYKINKIMQVGEQNG